MNWKELKQELLEYGYQEGQEYIVTKETEDELCLIFEGPLDEVEIFSNLFEEYDMAAELTSARFVIPRFNQEVRK